MHGAFICRSSGSPSVRWRRTLQTYKNRPHNYFSTAKISRTPFDSSKYGYFCNKYGYVFPILKVRINRHVRGPKYLIVSNLFFAILKKFCIFVVRKGSNLNPLRKLLDILTPKCPLCVQACHVVRVHGRAQILIN